MRKILIGMFIGMLVGGAFVAGTGIAKGATDDESLLTSWIPDLEEIFNTTMGNIFDSAGAKITDPELKEFYGRVTGDIAASLVANDVVYDTGISLTPVPIDPTPTPVP